MTHASRSPAGRTARTFLLTAVALAAATSWAFAAGPLDDALAAYKAGEFEKAAQIAGSVPKDDPSHAKALYLVGEAELARERWSDAATAFRAVLADKPESVPALTGLGRALTGSGEKDEAEKTLRRAVEADAKDVGARRALGEALLAADRLDDARKELAAAVKLDPKDPLTARSLVEACLRAEKKDDAKKAADAFAKAVPSSAMGKFLQGLVLDRSGKASDAIEAYEKAVKLDDAFLDAHKNLAVLYTTSNANYSNPSMVEKACVHAERYVALGGKDARLKELLDQIKGFLDQYKKGGGGSGR